MTWGFWMAQDKGRKIHENEEQYDESGRDGKKAGRGTTYFLDRRRE